ncbi:MAG: alkaline phosphatase family protein [Gemmatimonadota bacterium]|nr:alkaline phosphatase family protein [Gemmatimonadota bacterium]
MRSLCPFPPFRPILSPSLLILAALSGCSVLAKTPLGRIVALAEEGEEKVLRSPMRAASDGPRVLIFALDGVAEQAFVEALGSDALARVAELVGSSGGDRVYAHAYLTPTAPAVLPSMTHAAWTSLLTGAPPGRSGVPGNEWFDRASRRFFAPGPSSVSQTRHALEIHTDGLLGGQITTPTLYERADVRAYVALSAVHRGADLLIVPDPTDLGDLFRAVVKGTAGGWSTRQRVYGKIDRSGAEDFAEAVEEHGVPDLGVVYLPGIDLFTHEADPPLAEQRRYLREVTNPAIVEVLDAYAEARALEATWVLFVSDHGQTPVPSEERNALGTEGDAAAPQALRSAGFRVRPFSLETEEEDYQAVMAYNGFAAFVYLADRSLCAAPGARCDWTAPPREEDVLGAVRAFDDAHRTGDGAAELHGALDLILARVHAPGGESPPFSVWSGERLVSVADYLAGNPRPDLPELERRLRDLATGPEGARAGDILLLAKAGSDRPTLDRFYFGKPFYSMHGSPSAQDGSFFWMIAHANSGGVELRDLVRRVVGERPTQLDFTPLVLELLGRR